MSSKVLALTALLGAACFQKPVVETSLVEPVAAPIEETEQPREISYDWMFEEDAAALGTTVDAMEAGKGGAPLYLVSLVDYATVLNQNTELLIKTSNLFRTQSPNSLNPISCQDYFLLDRKVDDYVKNVFDNNEEIRISSAHYNPESKVLHLEDLTNTWQGRFTEARQDYRLARQSFESSCGENHLLEK
jgi:hypothetical protein